MLPAPTLESGAPSSGKTSSLPTEGKFSVMGTLSPFMHAASLPKELRSKVVKKMSCGAAHFAAITAGGEFFVCGSNKMGQLGIPIDHSESEHAVPSLSVAHLPFLRKM